MNGPGWIVCERTSRWASALRVAWERAARIPPPRLFEVRKLNDLAKRLAARPGSLVFVEVTPANLTELLTFVADHAPHASGSHFVALLDGESFASRAARQDVVDALQEAGVCEFTVSPRQLDGALSVARRHSELVAAHPSQSADLPFVDWAWSLLPWQGA